VTEVSDEDLVDEPQAPVGEIDVDRALRQTVQESGVVASDTWPPSAAMR
jgi:hypothetical protein